LQLGYDGLAGELLLPHVLEHGVPDREGQAENGDQGSQMAGSDPLPPTALRLLLGSGLWRGSGLAGKCRLGGIGLLLVRRHALFNPSRAARCTARHGVGSHAEPPTMEYAMLTCSSGRLAASGRGGESTRRERESTRKERLRV